MSGIDYNSTHLSANNDNATVVVHSTQDVVHPRALDKFEALWPHRIRIFVKSNAGADLLDVLWALSEGHSTGLGRCWTGLQHRERHSYVSHVWHGGSYGHTGNTGLWGRELQEGRRVLAARDLHPCPWAAVGAGSLGQLREHTQLAASAALCS